MIIPLTPRGESVLAKLSWTHSQQLHRMSPELGALLKKLTFIE